jgi:outer membrane biogenesis lipoprotein LolB
MQVSKHIFRFILLLVSVVLLLSACATKKALRNAELAPVKANQLFKSLENVEPDFSWFSGKMRIEMMQADGAERSFSANYKVQKDSLIWISIAPALGIELFRIMLLPDSIIILDKFNKQYRAGNFNSLSNTINADLSFKDLQDVMLGTPIKLDKTDKLMLLTEEQLYVLKALPNRKLRRGLGIEKNEKIEDETTDSTKVNRRVERAIEREEEVFVKRYFLNNELQYLGVNLHDVLSNRLLDIQYSNYNLVSEKLTVPFVISAKISDSKSSVTFGVEITKAKLTDKVSLRVKIPEKYERVDF